MFLRRLIAMGALSLGLAACGGEEAPGPLLELSGKVQGTLKSRGTLSLMLLWGSGKGVQGIGFGSRLEGSPQDFKIELFSPPVDGALINPTDYGSPSDPRFGVATIA